MKKKSWLSVCLLVPMVALAFLDNEIDWRYGRQGIPVVTNAPTRAMHFGLQGRVGETEDAVANYGPRLLFLENNAITSAPPQLVTSVNGQTGDVVIAEQDPKALLREGGAMDAGAAITLPTLGGDGGTHLAPEIVSVHSAQGTVSMHPQSVAVSTPTAHAEYQAGAIVNLSAEGTYTLPDKPGTHKLALTADVATHADRTDNPHQVTATQVGAITQATADSRYLSSTPGWFWQGSRAVITNEWTGAPHAPAQAGPGVNNFELIPYTTSRTDATGTVTITSSHYIVGVGCDWHLAKNPDLTFPSNPMVTKSRRVSSNEWELTAHCSASPTDANPFWFAYASNIVVMTYDRIEMRPGAYTNDAAGIITRVDDAPRGRNSTRFDDDRRAVNAGTLEAYINDRKTEIADHAYNRTPGGRDAPSKDTFTVDLPMVMQGQIAYLNSGDYYIMSYQGGDWYNSVTGSVWRIGPAGSVSFEIASTNRLLHIQGFHVSGGYATVDISTNWVAGTPAVEFTDSLINQQWLEAPEQIATDHGSYWRVVLPSGDKKMRFFRAVDRQGDNRIISHVTHEFKDDIILFGRRYSSLAELKQALEELD